MARPNNLYTVFGIILVLCIVSSNSEEANNDIPMSKLSNNVGAPTLTFLYWYVIRKQIWGYDIAKLNTCSYSCGYRKAFDEYASIIQQKYPFIIVDGRNYDPPGMNMFIARLLVRKILFYYNLQIILIFVLLFIFRVL